MSFAIILGNLLVPLIDMFTPKIIWKGACEGCQIRKASILKDALSLTIITIVCSFALAFVYRLLRIN